MDSELTTDQISETPEVTLNRTRELLVRSRATLDAATRRLQGYEDLAEAPGETATEPSH